MASLVGPERLEEAEAMARDWELNRRISRDAFEAKLGKELEAVGIQDLHGIIDRLPTSSRGRQLLTEIFNDPESDLAQDLLRKPPTTLSIVLFRGQSGLLLLPTGEQRRTTLWQHFEARRPGQSSPGTLRR